MATTSILINEIKQTFIDLKSDKVTVRTKALDNLNNLIDNRSTEINHVLLSDGNDTDWSYVYGELHIAITEQVARLDSSRSTASQSSLQNRNDGFKSALTKCINLANEKAVNVSLQKICSTAFECFGNATFRKYFHTCYLKIVNRKVLNANSNLDELRISDWSQLLSFIFELYSDRDCEASKLDLLQCLPPLLKNAAEYSYLLSDLSQYLPNLCRMVNDESHQYKAQKQLMLTIYEFIRGMALGERNMAIEFSENVLDKLLKMYQFTMDADSKEILFQLCHVSMVIHSPQNTQSGVNPSERTDLFAVNNAYDANVWNKHLRSMFSIVEREINETRKQLSRLNSTPSICDKLVQMAAKLCSMIFWNENIWNSGTNDEQMQKRRRQTMKLERMMELVEFEQNRFCWRWFAILAELLISYPHVFEADDYQPLLILLADYQPTIQHNIPLKPFNSVVKAMIQVESKLKSIIYSPIRDTFCNEYWHKIMELAFKQAATDKTQSDNLDLIGIIAENQRNVSHNFIKTMIADITMKSNIRKSNHSIALLIKIFRGVNVDLIDGSSELKNGVIDWLSSKVDASQLKKLMAIDSSLDKALISELYVLCTLSRQGESNSFVKKPKIPDANTIDEYREMINDLEKNLQYRTLSTLIVSDVKERIKYVVDDKKDNKLPDRNAIKSVINEIFNNKMEAALYSDDKFSENNNSIEDFNSICSSLTTYVNILNCFIEYEAIDQETFKTSNLVKRIRIRIEQLNQIVEKFANSLNFDRSPKDVNEIVDQLLDVWNDRFHSAVAEIIYTINTASIIRWVQKQLKPSRLPSSFTMKPIRMENELEFEIQVQLKCLTLLAHFSEWDTDNEAFDGIEEYSFRLTRNEHLFMVIELIKIIFDQKLKSMNRINWAFEWLKRISQKCQNNQNYMELVAKHIPALIKNVKYVNEDDMYDDLVKLLVAFLKQSRSKKYGARIAIQSIKSVQFFAQDFHQEEDCFDIVTVLSKFLASENLIIQFATIECLTNIFNKSWLCPDQESADCLFIQNFHTNLLEKLQISETPFKNDDTEDRKACSFSARLQLYCSIIGSCFVLRNQIWFQFIELCCNQMRLNGDKVKEIVNKLCMEMFDQTPFTMLENEFPELIMRWIQKDYSLSLIPWQLTECPSSEDFIQEYADCITLNIILFKPSLIPDLVQIRSARSIIDLLRLPVLMKTLAFITSVNVGQRNNKERNALAVNALKILREAKPNVDDHLRSDSLNILKEMLHEMWDREKFAELFGMNVEYVVNENTISYDVFLKSVKFLQTKQGIDSSTLAFFCEQETMSIINILYSLKLSLQKSICDELKLYQLFRICVLIDLINDFLIENAESTNYRDVVGFLVRDFVHFFGNIISNNSSNTDTDTGAGADKLKLAACNYFNRFMRKILPNCVNHFLPLLNYTVSILMSITKKKSTKIVNMAMDLLNFLIIEQKNTLCSAIGQLDSFPSQSEFEQLGQIQSETKYNGKEFSLLDEIEYFLRVDKRKVEGLLSLKDHLSTKKNQLQSIYKHIYDSRGFSEDCDKSIIHRLIFTLLQIVQGTDKERSFLAAKCLAELGPSDLGTMVLKFDIQTQNYKVCNSFDAAIENLCECVLEKLDGLFAHSDANVLITTFTACQRLLQSQKAISFLEKHPLLNVFKTVSNNDLPLIPTQRQLELSKWFDDRNFISTHSNWVKNLVIELFTWFECEYLAALAALQGKFAEAMVPLLIKAILSTKNEAHIQDINICVNLFFEYHFNNQGTAAAQNESSPTFPVYLNKFSIKLMLNVAECIRIHNQNMDHQKDRLCLNYLHIAKAASFCDAHFTTILYGELALEEAPTTEFTGIKSIMKTAYQSIGVLDAVTAFLDPIEQPIEYLELNQKWSEIFTILDADPTTDHKLYSHYLAKPGLYGLANKLSQNVNLGANYECAWRLSDWSILNDENIEISTQMANDSMEFDKYQYFALKCLQQKDEIGVRFNIDKATDAIVKTLKQSSYECTKNIYKDLMKLHMLQQIEEFCDIQFPDSKNLTQRSAEFIINKWKFQDAVPFNEFSCREPILAQRITIFKSVGVRAQRKIENVYNLTNGIQEMILNLAKECREENYENLGQRYLSMLRQLNMSKDIKINMMLENAQLSWDRGHLGLTKQLIESVINEKSTSASHFIAMRMYGEYLAETGAESAQKVIDSYFKKSIIKSNNFKSKMEDYKMKDFYLPPAVVGKIDLENRKRNYHAMAKYADREYQRIADYKKSAEFEKKQRNFTKNKKLIADMEKKSLRGEEGKSYTLLTKSTNIDKSDIQSTNKEYDLYLKLSVENYIECLLFEDETDCFLMFRLFSLLLANQTDSAVLNEIQAKWNRIASYKFIEVVPQIIAHLTTSDDDLGNVIGQIILKSATDHPHHVLMNLFALSNAYKDDEFEEKRNSSGHTSSTPRTDASKQLLAKLKQNSKLRTTIEQMDQMCIAMIALANKDMRTSKVFSSSEPLIKLKKLNMVHCPTIKLSIDPSGKYDNIIGISHWQKEFSTPGGINAPKRIECIGSNGKRYSQLLKGKDDLRQDAVMQQVFNIMNNMLNQSKVTKKDRLCVRTYAVIPLSKRSGILEWCTNTMPIGEYLIGAHKRYRPNDLSPSDCRKQYSQYDRNHSFERRHTNFVEICKKIQPIFHHFFYEKFYNPGVWFERRLAYAHSLATTSMIGYVLGIGDRHVNNILIDNSTAELIHIDFGIAFEQNKCLPTPETIPFRLTRDMVSALGTTGVEGVYRKSCEKSMEVLRQHKSTILTIVEVLLHDPLYSWALTSSAAAKRQQTDIQIDEQDLNTMAERALLRVEEKLNGKCESRGDSLAVERQVDILIREATNDKNLCRVFSGWQPYL